MASYYPIGKPMKSKLPVPITLTAFQTYVGGFVRFIELSCGGLMVVNEAALPESAALNEDATKLAGKAGPIYGDAVYCDPSEIA